MTIKSSIMDLRKSIIKNENGVNKYKIITSFKGTTAESESMVCTFLRRFIPIKDSRKSNVESGFDYFNDTLMDYPSIIQHKLGGDLQSFNMLISVHVPCCPYNCWHCYNNKKLHSIENAEFFSAREIVQQFLNQRKSDKGRSRFKRVTYYWWRALFIT